MTLDIDLIQFSKTEYIATGDGAKLRPGYLRRKQAAPSQIKQRRIFAENLFRTCFSGRYNPRALRSGACSFFLRAINLVVSVVLCRST